jgi:hypothetical protein
MAGQRGPGRQTRGRRRAAAAGLLALALGGCVASPQATGTLQPITFGPTPRVTHFEIGTGVYINGFLVKVEDATASLDTKGGPVTVVAEVENLGPDASLDVPITLATGGATFELARGTELPLQSSGETDRVELEFEVLGRTSIEDGEIRIGRPCDHVAVIPLVADPTRLVSLEPRFGSIDTLGRAGSLHVALRQLSLRWDLPDVHDELPTTAAALTLFYDVTYTGDFAGGTAFTNDNVRLRLPDGTLVAPRADGHSQTIVLIHRNEFSDGMLSRFEIPSGLTGTFALVVRDGSVQAAIPFDLGP